MEQEIKREFINNNDLVKIFLSKKVVRILTKEILKPVISSNSRLKLYPIDRVYEVADRIKTGALKINLKEGRAEVKSNPHTQ